METDQIQVTRAWYKRKFPTVRSMYEFLEMEGWYLPEFQKHGNVHRCFDEDYLMRLILEQAFRIQRSEIRVAPTLKRSCKKEELVGILDKLVENRTNFGPRTPPKEWIVNVIHTIDPKNSIFVPVTQLKDEILRKIPNEYKKIIVVDT